MSKKPQSKWNHKEALAIVQKVFAAVGGHLFFGQVSKEEKAYCEFCMRQLKVEQKLERVEGWVGKEVTLC